MTNFFVPDHVSVPLDHIALAAERDGVHDQETGETEKKGPDLVTGNGRDPGSARNANGPGLGTGKTKSGPGLGLEIAERGPDPVIASDPRKAPVEAAVAAREGRMLKILLNSLIQPLWIR